MTENTVTEIENEITLPEIVQSVIGTETDVTAYKIAVYVNKVFTITGTEKQVPTQMMYNYTRNGMIVKGKKGSAKEIRYTNEEAVAFVTKYTSKYISE